MDAFSHFSLGYTSVLRVGVDNFHLSTMLSVVQFGSGSFGQWFSHLHLLSYCPVSHICVGRQRNTFPHWKRYGTSVQTCNSNFHCSVRLFNTYSGLLIMSLTFSVICIKIISCFPSPCTRLSPAQTTTEAPLPCRIFIGLYLIALRRSDLGNPRLRYNNMAMIDCRIWLPPVTAYCGCAVICSCLYYTTLATEVLRYSELSYLSL